MKIRVEHGDFEENEIVLNCKILDDEMLEVLSLIKERFTKLTVEKDGETHVIAPNSIYYVESVDGKTFVYTADMVLESTYILNHFQIAYENVGLIRINKSQIVNLYHVEKLKSLPNSKIEITIKGGEKMIVSRHYIQNLKERIGMLG